jgi:hypothetical protein
MTTEATMFHAVLISGGLTLIGLAIAVSKAWQYQTRLLAGLTSDLAQKHPLTANESEFYYRLKRALPEYEVLAQVAFSAFVKTGLPETDPQFWEEFDKYSRKTADFVVCLPKSFAPVAVIELDDRTHDAAKDARRDAMLAKAGIHVLRWDSRDKPSQVEIAKAVAGVAPQPRADLARA